MLSRFQDEPQAGPSERQRRGAVKASGNAPRDRRQPGGGRKARPPSEWTGLSALPLKLAHDPGPLAQAGMGLGRWPAEPIGVISKALWRQPSASGRWPGLELVGALARRTNRCHLESALETALGLGPLAQAGMGLGRWPAEPIGLISKALWRQRWATRGIRSGRSGAAGRPGVVGEAGRRTMAGRRRGGRNRCGRRTTSCDTASRVCRAPGRGLRPRDRCGRYRRRAGRRGNHGRWGDARRRACRT